MPLDQVITNLPYLKVIKVSGTSFLNIEAISTKKVICIYCKSENLRKKDTFIRKVRHITLGKRCTRLNIKAHKFKCKDCSRYFNQRFEGILPRKRSSELFRSEVSTDHHYGISQKTLSRTKGLSCSTIEKWYHDKIERENRKFSKTCPKHIGIDEHFFSKKKGFATTFVDLGKHRVFNLELGRSEKSLRSFLSRLEGRDNVETINMDLSETYRSIARKYFPKAKIVADRFHVIRLVNHHFNKTWQILDPKSKNSRGLLSLVRRHHWRLKPEQKENLKEYLESVPGLKALYNFKQSLNTLLVKKTLNAKQFKRVIPKLLWMIEELKGSGFENMRRLGRTMCSWKEPILRMLRYTKNNSITEGFHNKMEMISRRAFGFRNFKNYRLRVRVHCGYQM